MPSTLAAWTLFPFSWRITSSTCRRSTSRSCAGRAPLATRRVAAMLDEVLRQVVERDGVLLGQDLRPFQHVGQLADVAGPIVARQRVHRLGRRCVNGCGPICRVVEEMLDQLGNVLPAIAQRRQMDRDDVEAIVQILAELGRPSARPRDSCWWRR